MLLPTIMFRKLVKSSVLHRDTLRVGIQTLEFEIGRKDVHNREQELRPEDHETRHDYLELSRQLKGWQKAQASRDGRHKFWRQFHSTLEKSFEHVKKATPNGISQIDDAHQELRNMNSFHSKIFESLEGRDVNYGARIEAQMTLVN